MGPESERELITNILNRNAEKSFVQRILNPDKSPRLDLGNNQFATHKMATSEADGKFYAHPTVLFNGKDLVDYGREAFPMALKTGNVIEFPSADQAEWFSQRYKSYWGQ